MASKANVSVLPGIIIWLKMQNRDGQLFYKLALSIPDHLPSLAIVVVPFRKLLDIKERVDVEFTIVLVQHIPGKVVPQGDIEVVKTITALIVSQNEHFKSDPRLETLR